MEQSECVEQQTSGAASDPTASLPADRGDHFGAASLSEC